MNKQRMIFLSITLKSLMKVNIFPYFCWVLVVFLSVVPVCLCLFSFRTSSFLVCTYSLLRQLLAKLSVRSYVCKMFSKSLKMQDWVSNDKKPDEQKQISESKLKE